MSAQNGWPPMRNGYRPPLIFRPGSALGDQMRSHESILLLLRGMGYEVGPRLLHPHPIILAPPTNKPTRLIIKAEQIVVSAVGEMKSPTAARPAWYRFRFPVGSDLGEAHGDDISYQLEVYRAFVEDFARRHQLATEIATLAPLLHVLSCDPDSIREAIELNLHPGWLRDAFLLGHTFEEACGDLRHMPTELFYALHATGAG